MEQQVQEKGKTKKKIIWQLIFVAVNIAVVIIIALVDFGDETVTAPFSDAARIIGKYWYYFTAAVGLALLSIFLDVLK